MERLFINGQYVVFLENVRIVVSWAKAGGHRSEMRLKIKYKQFKIKDL